MSTLLIVFMILLYSLQTLFCKLYSDNYPGKEELASPVFCVLESGAIAVLSWAFAGFKFEISPVTLLIGVINAAVLFGYNTSIIKASARGSYTFMNVMMLFGGILLPLIFTSTVLGDEPLTLIKYVAIFAILVACVLINFEGLRQGNIKLSYYLYCGLLFLTNGAYGVIIKIQSVYNDAQSQEMIIVTYLIMGVIAFIQLYAKEKKDTFKAFKFNKKSMLFLVLCLISAGLAVNLLVVLFSFINAAVLCTVDNGGVLMLSAIYSITLFKEKPTVWKIIGILLALVSIVVLSI